MLRIQDCNLAATRVGRHGHPRLRIADNFQYGIMALADPGGVRAGEARAAQRDDGASRSAGWRKAVDGLLR